MSTTLNEQQTRFINLSHDAYEAYHYQWAFQEGWRPTTDSAAAFYQLDPEGFHLLQVEGKDAASIAVIRYPNIQTAWIGFYITAQPAYRGHGYGKQLWDHITKPLMDSGYHLGLLCFSDMSPMYEKSGFQTVGEDSIWQWSPATEVPPRQRNNRYKIITANHANFDKLAVYDKAITGVNRQAFLKLWLQKQDTTTALCLDAQGTLVGYGVMSSRLLPPDGNQTDYCIGPLYAESAEIAEWLCSTLLSKQSEKSVALIAPYRNKQSAGIFTRLGCKKIISFHRMLRENDMSKPFHSLIPDEALEKVFASASPAYTPY